MALRPRTSGVISARAYDEAVARHRARIARRRHGADVMILSGGWARWAGHFAFVGQGRRGMAGIERVRLPRLRRADLRDGVRVGRGIAAALAPAIRPARRDQFLALSAPSHRLPLLRHPPRTVRFGAAVAPLCRVLARYPARVLCGVGTRRSPLPARPRRPLGSTDGAGCRREATPRRAIARRSCRVLAHRGEWRAPLCRRQLSTSRPVRPQQSNPQQRARCRWPVRR